MKLKGIILGLIFSFILSSCVIIAPEKNISREMKECSITIECSDILEGETTLSEEIIKNISKDGVIVKENAEFNEGETAFDILQREINKKKLHIDFEKSPVYNSIYIKGINNIYEGDFGENSGWMFFVNGNLADTDSSNYTLNEGDEIVFSYVNDYSELF